MMNIFNLLGSGTTPMQDIVKVIDNIKVPLNMAMLGLIILLGVAGMVYAVWIALKLAKAEDEGKRKEAKSHLIYAIVGVLSAAVLFVLLTTVFNGVTLVRYDATGDGSVIGKSVDEVLLLVSKAISTLFSLASIIAMGFALYIAWKLMSADEENKRKQAKAQLMWTIIAVISIILINAILSTVLGTLAGEFRPKSGTGVFTLLTGMF